MTLQELQHKWKDEFPNWDVNHLKDCDEFVADCFNYKNFAAYVLRVKPEMAKPKAFKIHFLGLSGTSAGSTEKTPVIEAQEPVEEISKTRKIITDLKAYCKKNGYVTVLTPPADATPGKDTPQ